MLKILAYLKSRRLRRHDEYVAGLRGRMAEMGVL